MLKSSRMTTKILKLKGVAPFQNTIMGFVPKIFATRAATRAGRIPNRSPRYLHRRHGFCVAMPSLMQAPHEKHSNDGTHEDSTLNFVHSFLPTSTFQKSIHVWYIYLHILYLLYIYQQKQPKVGKYIPYMDPMGLDGLVQYVTKDYEKKSEIATQQVMSNLKKNM